MLHGLRERWYIWFICQILVYQQEEVDRLLNLLLTWGNGAPGSSTQAGKGFKERSIWTVREYGVATLLGTAGKRFVHLLKYRF